VTGATNTIQTTITVGVQNFPGAASATTMHQVLLQLVTLQQRQPQWINIQTKYL
jgi:hypothetical protein